MKSDTILWLQRPIGEETRPISVTIFVNYFAEQQGGDDAQTMMWGEMVSVRKRKCADIIHKKRVGLNQPENCYIYFANCAANATACSILFMLFCVLFAFAVLFA